MSFDPTKINRKPSRTELEQGMKEGLEEYERLEKEGEEEEETPTPPKPKEPKDDPIDDPEDEEEEEEEDIPEDEDSKDDEEGEDDSEDDEEDPKPPKAPKTPKTDEEKEIERLKKEKERSDKRYSDSSSEAHMLFNKSKKMSDAIKKAGQVEEPTEDELKAKYPSWDVMDDDQRQLARDSMVTQRRLDAIQEASKEFEDIDQWNTKVDEFLSDPGTIADIPDLEGKEEDFKIFATSRQSRMGVDFEDLVASFLYAESQKPKPPKKKGKQFPTGTSGENQKPKQKSDKISIADSRILRNTDYPKYLELLKAGKIDNDIDNI